MILRTRDPFGFERVVYHPASAAVAGNLRTLLREAALDSVDIDRDAVAGYLSGRRLADRTVVDGVKSVPPGHALARTPHGFRVEPAPVTPLLGDLETLLFASLQGVLDRGRRVAIALSGGLDSALLLAMLHALGARDVPAYILAADLPGYGELDAALATARRCNAEVVVVPVGEHDFVDAVPQAMQHLDEPLFNLHPIAKWLLARAMHRDGIEVALSGDGADQVIGRDASADYLPLCKALFEAAGVTLVPPFLDEAVCTHLLGLPVDPDKACVRRLAERLGVSPALVDGPKQSRLAPPMAIDHLLARDRIAIRASTWGMPMPSLRTDAERVHWATLMLLMDRLPVDA